MEKQKVIEKALTIPGLMNEQELNFLYDMPEIKGNGLEIGTYFGRTTYLLANKCNYLTTLDGFDLNVGERREEYLDHSLDEVMANLQDVLDNTLILEMDTEHGLSSLVGQKFDFAFVDGDHRHDQVLKELNTLAELTDTIIGHDGKNWGVRSAIQDFITKRNLECVTYQIGEYIWMIKL